MIQLNKVILAGRLGRDPDVRDAGTTRIAEFSIAMDRPAPSKDGGDREKLTTWVTIKAFAKQAEFAERWLKKGSAVLVDGELQEEKWKDKETGKDRSKLVVIARHLSFGESKGESEGRTAGPQEAAYSPPAARFTPPPHAYSQPAPPMSEDLPF
jgi:single-strand DNA-binding protein